jgi:hypothetical protein
MNWACACGAGYGSVTPLLFLTYFLMKKKCSFSFLELCMNIRNTVHSLKEQNDVPERILAELDL